MKILVLQHIKCPSNGNKVTYMRLMYQFFISPLSLRRLWEGLRRSLVWISALWYSISKIRLIDLLHTKSSCWYIAVPMPVFHTGLLMWIFVSTLFSQWQRWITLVVGATAERWHRIDLLDFEDGLESKVHPFWSLRLAWRDCWIVVAISKAYSFNCQPQKVGDTTGDKFAGFTNTGNQVGRENKGVLKLRLICLGPLYVTWSVYRSGA